MLRKWSDGIVKPRVRLIDHHPVGIQQRKLRLGIPRKRADVLPLEYVSRLIGRTLAHRPRRGHPRGGLLLGRAAYCAAAYYCYVPQRLCMK